MLISELAGDHSDLNDIRALLIPELHLLDEGVEMFVNSQHGTRWVYAHVVAQLADTQEQYKNVGCRAPGGLRSERCCPQCMSTREDFATGICAPDRNPICARNAIWAAANDPQQRNIVAILQSVGLGPRHWQLQHGTTCLIHPPFSLATHCICLCGK